MSAESSFDREASPSRSPSDANTARPSSRPSTAGRIGSPGGGGVPPNRSEACPACPPSTWRLPPPSVDTAHVTQPLIDDTTTDAVGAPPAVWATGLVRRFGRRWLSTMSTCRSNRASSTACSAKRRGKDDNHQDHRRAPPAERGQRRDRPIRHLETRPKSRLGSGVLPEEFNLYERLTGAELLDLTAMHGLDREEATKRRTEPPRPPRPCRRRGRSRRRLLMGMRKKVALGAAIIHRPRVLFLDELFEGVDAVSLTDPSSPPAGGKRGHHHRFLLV